MSDATTPANPTGQIATTPASCDEDVRLVQSAILGLEWTEAKQAALDRLAAHIERLEAERDALLAEHEAWDEWGNHSGDALAKEVLLGIAVEAHDNAERVIRGE